MIVTLRLQVSILNPIPSIQKPQTLSPHTLIPYTLAVTLRLQVSILKPQNLQPQTPNLES